MSTSDAQEHQDLTFKIPSKRKQGERRGKEKRPDKKERERERAAGRVGVPPAAGKQWRKGIRAWGERKFLREDSSLSLEGFCEFVNYQISISASVM